MPELPSKDSQHILGYRLIERLGAGGFGEVWKAEAPGGLLKAVKFIYGHFGGRQVNREVKALDWIKELRHPFILSLERVEVVDGRLIMINELADKTVLDRFEECRADGRQGIPRGELLRYMHDAAEALDFMATQFRLQHLDVKPSNLFLVGGRLKIGDFSLVRDVCDLSGSNSVAVSPAYAAPEAWRGDVGLYADQYGLAVTYQEMLTGVRPFRGRTVLQLSEQHLHAEPILASLAVAEQPIIGRALAKDPNDRFTSCGEMIRALATIEIAESPAEVSVDGTDVEPEPQSSTEHFEPKSRSNDEAETQVRTYTLETWLIDAPTEHGDRSTPIRGTPSAELSAGGLPEPTLFVGIGGIAGSVLRQIKYLFKSRNDCPAEEGCLGWLLLDTDPAGLEEIRRPEVPGHLANDETVHIPLHEAAHYRPRFNQLRGWLGRHWLFSIPRTHLTEGIRPLGRLALIDNAEVVLGCLRRSMRRLYSTTSTEEGKQRFQIIVIAGIAGGTGGGCLADVGLSIRRILAEERIDGATVNCILIVAASVRKDCKELARANAHVTLSELRHYHDPRCRFPGVEALGIEPTVEGIELFDEIALSDFGDIVVDEDLESSSHLLAEWIYLRRGTPYGRARMSQLREADRSGAPDRLTSFRMVRLGFPRAELRRLIGREVCERMIDRWLHGPPTMADDYESAESTANLLGDIDTPDPPLIDADALFAEMELDDGRLQEIFLERAERAFGSDPLESCLRKAKEMLASRGLADVTGVLLQCFDELDQRLGRVSGNNPGLPRTSTFERRLRDEFKYDRNLLEQRLENWVRAIVDHPSQRLRGAAEMLDRFIRVVDGQIDSTPARIEEIQGRKRRLRARHEVPTAGRWRRVFNSLRPTHGEAEAASVELTEYGELCITETAIGVRAEILASLRAAASRIGDDLRVWHRHLAEAQRLFEAEDPGFQSSHRASLGHSIDLLPVETIRLDELRTLLASSFSSERRLARLDRRFQDEVLAAHGGLSGVLMRESRFASELFANTLFQRVRAAVDHWLESQDAALILHKQYGSMEAVVDDLARQWKTAIFGFPEHPAQRLFVGTPASPAGRSLRESLMKSASPLRNSVFVTIPNDIVLCLEVEDLSFATASAGLVGGQDWITEVAPKLVSRIDIDWAALPGFERTVEVVDARE